MNKELVYVAALCPTPPPPAAQFITASGKTVLILQRPARLNQAESGTNEKAYVMTCLAIGLWFLNFYFEFLKGVRSFFKRLPVLRFPKLRSE